MRIDKFLKVSRIIKRRSVSKDIVSFGPVKINNRVAKPSTNITVGDIVEFWYIKYNQQIYANGRVVELKTESNEVVIDINSENFYYIIDIRQIQKRFKRESEIQEEKEKLLQILSEHRITIPKMDYIKIINKNTGEIINTDYITLPKEDKKDPIENNEELE